MNLCVLLLSANMNGNCPNCIHNPRKGGSTTPCDGCKVEVHLSCVGLSSEDIRITRNKSRSIKILCNNCNLFMGQLGEFKNLLTSLKDDFNKKFMIDMDLNLLCRPSRLAARVRCTPCTLGWLGPGQGDR